MWLLSAGGHSNATTCSNLHGWAAGPLRHAAEVRGRSLLQQQGALRASAIACACCMPPCSRPINKPAWDPRSVYHAAASTYAIRRNDGMFVANANRPKSRGLLMQHARTHALLVA